MLRATGGGGSCRRSRRRTSCGWACWRAPPSSTRCAGKAGREVLNMHSCMEGDCSRQQQGGRRRKATRCSWCHLGTWLQPQPSLASCIKLPKQWLLAAVHPIAVGACRCTLLQQVGPGEGRWLQPTVRPAVSTTHPHPMLTAPAAVHCGGHAGARFVWQGQAVPQHWQRHAVCRQGGVHQAGEQGCWASQGSCMRSGVCAVMQFVSGCFSWH